MTPIVNALPDNLKVTWDENEVDWLSEEPEDIELNPLDFIDNHNTIQSYKVFLLSNFMLTTDELAECIQYFRDERFDDIEKERIRLCGQVQWTFNVKNKTWKEDRFQCNCYHGCKWCANAKKRQTEERLKRLIGCQLVIVQCAKERARLIRKYGSDDTFCQPTDDGNIQIVINTLDKIGQQLTYEDAIKIAAMSIPGKGEGRQSGKLGKELKPAVIEDEEKESDEPMVEITSRSMVIDADREEAEKILLSASGKITQGTFTNKIALQQAVNKIEQDVERQCKNKGIVVLFILKNKAKYKLSDIDWSKPVEKQFSF